MPKFSRSNRRKEIQFFYRIGEPLFGGASYPTIARFLMLSTFIGYDGVVMKTERTPMKTSEIETVLNLTSSPTYEFLAEAEELGLLSIRKDKTIVVNPAYATRGRDAFKKSGHLPHSGVHMSVLVADGYRNMYLKQTPKHHRLIGQAMSLYPYANRYWNVLCRNQTTRALDRLDLIKWSEAAAIANIGGDNTGKFKRECLDLGVLQYSKEKKMIQFNTQIVIGIWNHRDDIVYPVIGDEGLKTGTWMDTMELPEAEDAHPEQYAAILESGRNVIKSYRPMPCPKCGRAPDQVEPVMRVDKQGISYLRCVHCGYSFSPCHLIYGKHNGGDTNDAEEGDEEEDFEIDPDEGEAWCPACGADFDLLEAIEHDPNHGECFTHCPYCGHHITYSSDDLA